MPGDLEVPRLALRHIQEIVRDTRQVLAGTPYPQKETALLLGQQLFELFVEQLEVAEHRVERRPDLVCGQCHESFLDHERPFSNELRRLGPGPGFLRDDTQSLDLGLSPRNLVERAQQLLVLKLQLSKRAAVSSRGELVG